MAPVVSFVHGGKNRLRFLLDGSDGVGGTVVFTTTGLQNSIVTNLALAAKTGNGGTINKIVFAATKGYGQIAAGALTQAQARGLWLDDRSGANANPGANLPCAQPSLTRNGGTGNLDPSVDANVDGNGNPVINVVIPAQVGLWYFDLATPGTIGD